MLRTKVLTGIVALPLMFLLLYIGGWAVFVPACIVALIGLQEFYSALMKRDIIPVQEAGWLGTVGILAATQWAPEETRSGIVTACVAGVVFGALIAQFWRRRGTSAIANAGATVFGAVYVALLFSYLLHLRLLPLSEVGSVEAGSVLDRIGAILLVVAAVWIMDIAANVIGRYFGKGHPWPNVSPNKTYQGSLAGLLASIAAALVIGWLCRLPVIHMLILGIVLAVTGQLGDLCESLLKRDLGLKDFGAIIPGHGGVLDRFDSLLFAMPVAYYYLIYIVARGGA